MAKKRTSITELAQLDEAYGRELTWKRQVKIALKPAIITMLFSFVFRLNNPQIFCQTMFQVANISTFLYLSTNHCIFYQ